VSVRHHDLCFGCGRTNLFGLTLELEATGPGRVAGRCFIKQDHQGADLGTAHEGLVATALSEAMALASGTKARARRIQVEFGAPVAVGTFLEVEAEAHGPQATATAAADGTEVARAVGSYDS
jgi:acyl-coenzyme A thioesterase PaaI-like protein